MTRLLKIDPADYSNLDTTDECWHIGEYTARGGFRASETNQQIWNFKKKPTVPPEELYWKNIATQYWANKLRTCLNLAAAAASVTFVPAPCSKLQGDPAYDDRMAKVLHLLANTHPGLDIRPVVFTSVLRRAQHDGERLSVPELQSSMALDNRQLTTPLRRTVIVIDDVFTQGGTFKAMQNLLQPIHNAERVVGVFFARTVWPNPFTDFEP